MCALFKGSWSQIYRDLMSFVQEVFLQNTVYEGYSNDSGHTVY